MIESFIRRVVCSDFCYSAEDMEQIEQMHALGLPVSFLTNKEVCSYPEFVGTFYSSLRLCARIIMSGYSCSSFLLIKNVIVSRIWFLVRGNRQRLCLHGRSVSYF